MLKGWQDSSWETYPINLWAVRVLLSSDHEKEKWNEHLEVEQLGWSLLGHVTWERMRRNSHRLTEGDKGLLLKKTSTGWFALVHSRHGFTAPANEEPIIGIEKIKRTLKILAMTILLRMQVLKEYWKLRRLCQVPQKLAMHHAGWYFEYGRKRNHQPNSGSKKHLFVCYWCGFSVNYCKTWYHGIPKLLSHKHGRWEAVWREECPNF